MPSNEEKIFFIRALGLIDNQNGTHWLPSYCALQSQSPNGRIDWGRIPGLLGTNQYKGTGYKKAVNRVVEILGDYIEDVETDPDPKLRQLLRELALLAKGIYTRRQRALEFHGGNDIETWDVDAGHIAACSVWEDASEVLDAAFAIEEIQQQQNPQRHPRIAYRPSIRESPYIPSSYTNIGEQPSVRNQNDERNPQLERYSRQQEHITRDQYEMTRTKKIILAGVVVAVSFIVGLTLWLTIGS